MLIFSTLCATVAVPALFLWRLYFVRIGEISPAADGLLYQLATDHPHGLDLDLGLGLNVGLSPGDLAIDHRRRKRIHSHNDYERRTPLYEALHYGAESVEADVWLVDGQLLVGHTEHDLDPRRTLASLYLDPLMDLIAEANATQRPGAGLFHFASTHPLQLIVDIKSAGAPTFAAVHAALAPLRAAGYLTTWTRGHPRPSPSLLTVIASGDAPLASVQALGASPAAPPRDLFLDAPLAALATPAGAVYTPALSPLASASFGRTVALAWLVPCLGPARLRALVDAAHARGIEVRFWSTPKGFLRNYSWRVLLDNAVDWLNVDDLAAAARF